MGIILSRPMDSSTCCECKLYENPRDCLLIIYFKPLKPRCAERASKPHLKRSQVSELNGIASFPSQGAMTAGVRTETRQRELHTWGALRTAIFAFYFYSVSAIQVRCLYSRGGGSIAKRERVGPDRMKSEKHLIFARFARKKGTALVVIHCVSNFN